MKLTDEQIGDIFSKASVEIQEALESQELLDMLHTFETKYLLHTTTVDKTAELIRNLMLGITSPKELNEELILIGVSPETAEKVLGDINTVMFMPLRDKVKPPVIPSQNPAPAPIPPQPIPAVPKPLMPAPSLVPPPPSISSMPPIAPPAAVLPTEIPVSEATAEAWKPEVRTMAHDVEAIKTGNAPVSQPPAQPVPPPPAPAPVKEAPLPDPWSAPVTPPPVNSIPAVTRTPVPNPEELKQGLKQYGIDPYREQID